MSIRENAEQDVELCTTTLGGLVAFRTETNYEPRLEPNCSEGERVAREVTNGKLSKERPWLQQLLASPRLIGNCGLPLSL